jgi:Tol biopolymer transport system component
MYDLTSKKMTMLSVARDGTQGDGESRQAVISPNGRYVAFQSRATTLVPGDTNGMKDVFLRDLETGEIARMSVSRDGTEGSGDSSQAAISADGRCVAFRSAAANLVPEDTNGKSDIFMSERAAPSRSR